jgi:hypothetical protein
MPLVRGAQSTEPQPPVDCFNTKRGNPRLCHQTFILFYPILICPQYSFISKK